MFSNSALVLIVILNICIAQFSPFTALILSIALTATEVAYLYINQEELYNV